MRYRYVLRNTHLSSERLGNCEVCDKPGIPLYYMSEEREFISLTTEGWTRHGCRTELFGHLGCLLNIQLGQVEQMEIITQVED